MNNKCAKNVILDVFSAWVKRIFASIVIINTDYMTINAYRNASSDARPAPPLNMVIAKNVMKFSS